MKRRIDLETYPRKAHYEYFKTMAYPYAGLTVPVDITAFHQKIKEGKRPFFLSLLYAASRAINQVPELRRRLDVEGIVEYDWCNTSHTVALEDGTYCYCELNSNMEYGAFIEYAVRRQEEAKQNRHFGDGENADSLLFVSSLPWVSYTALVQPVPSPADSNPRLTFGKFYVEAERVRIPVSILAHHALADGLHLGAFYQKLEEEMEHLVQVLD